MNSGNQWIFKTVKNKRHLTGYTIYQEIVIGTVIKDARLLSEWKQITATVLTK